MAEYECLYCGTKFRAKPRNQKFCSHECYIKYRVDNYEKYKNCGFKKGMIPWNKKEHIRKVCKFCGREFFVIPSESNRKFCNMACFAEYKRSNPYDDKSPVIKPRMDFKLDSIDKRPEFAYLLGVLATDGVLGDMSFSMTTTDYSFARIFLNTLQNLFPGIPKFYSYGKYYWVGVCRVALCRFLKRYGPFGTYDWRVPGMIFDAEVEIKSAYLRGAFDSDGGVVFNIKNSDRLVSLRSVNYLGLRDVERILMDFSIKPRIYTRKIGYSLRISGRKNLLKYWESIGFGIPEKQALLTECIQSYRRWCFGPRYRS